MTLLGASAIREGTSESFVLTDVFQTDIKLGEPLRVRIEFKEYMPDSGIIRLYRFTGSPLEIEQRLPTKDELELAAALHEAEQQWRKRKEEENERFLDLNAMQGEMTDDETSS